MSVEVAPTSVTVFRPAVYALRKQNIISFGKSFLRGNLLNQDRLLTKSKVRIPSKEHHDDQVGESIHFKFFANAEKIGCSQN